MDCLTDWPEPIVRVQSLSESGTPTVPPRYVKPPPDRPCLEIPLCGDDDDVNIPTVDLADPSAASAVSTACKDWGFFQAVNHGVPTELMSSIMEAWREFFHLPMATKQTYSNSPKTYEGYGSRLGIEKGAILDWGDYYFLHLTPLCLKNQDKWPSLPVSLRGAVEEYGKELRRLCWRVMELLSVGLGLDGGRLQRGFGGEDAGACIRVNYYPTCPQPELTLGLSSHSDPGGITLLLPDERVKGLQVRHGGRWVTVRPLPGGFIVNVGDQVQILSNGIYRSVEHRVAVNSSAERLSIAFFYNPRSDLLLGPLPELVNEDQPARYQPMTFDQYRLYMRKQGPRGKSHVESLKAI
ncbi:probable 2-oxoglutarate-dependent dioxygenase At3g111800 [Phalaenopsis equestris]|uniref:probable 2-oxoglutarate-dependent dioxygenase At3g111800 n=1 Tax=Phalaenopsis equestris TaxID=78828 RepID=UPI0009E1FB69|nr:probable 2-oxoglutarate-dependent dioxygenase At3g111800 [Phalaenopsis equestris]